jgi:hypothetical protein
MEWLLESQRGVKALVWTGAAVGLFQSGLVPLFVRFIGVRSLWMVMWPLGFALTALQGALFAAAASWFFVEARRNGELELLMTTPVGASTILSSQWTMLKRVVQWPAAVMMAPIPLMGLFNALMYSFRLPASMGGYFLLNSLFSAVDVMFGIAAICWTGLWFGLTAQNRAAAIIWAVGLVKGMPFLITLLSQMIIPRIGSAYAFAAGGVAWLIMLAPQVVVLWYYVKLIQWARKKLSWRFAPTAVRSFRQRRSCDMMTTGVK